jgi:hypothetical protein
VQWQGNVIYVKAADSRAIHSLSTSNCITSTATVGIEREKRTPKSRQ